jgi:hypothetical protein
MGICGSNATPCTLIIRTLILAFTLAAEVEYRVQAHLYAREELQERPSCPCTVLLKLTGIAP